MAKPRDTFILARGDYRNQSEKVEPGVPAVLPPLPQSDAPREPPRPGRVAGRSVASADRARGRESLLADVFRHRPGEDRGGFRLAGRAAVAARTARLAGDRVLRTNWDVKAMQRLIVTSATYRQSSQVTPELLEKDPENRLLARGPRFRLPAEMVRDNALAVSGLLNRQDRRPERVPVPAAGPLGRDCRAATASPRRTYRAEPRRRSVPPQHVHVLEAHRAARRADHLRCARSREVHVAPH